MKAYIYAADIYCEDCAEGIKRDLIAANKATGQEEDSDSFPQGPHANGGGEADSPQHCGACGQFLDNVLTQDGSIYVKGAWREFVESGRGNLDVLRQWRDGYICEWSEFSERMDASIDEGDRTDLEERRFRDLEAGG